MSLLSDFLDHGVLPFAGRSQEMEIIARHWQQSTMDDRGLQLLLLSGEAGVGKSRLLQRAVEQMELERGIVVQLKLYPESANAFAPLLATALGRSRNGRALLRGEPEENLVAAVETLRRFARLRPTMLVVEDIHLLAGETLREFSQVIEGVRDEPLALLCAARPLDSPARGVIERWAMKEIPVEPLSRGEVGEMWQALFEQQPDEESLEALWQSTLGNPLALRAAMRGAMRSEALVRGSNGRWSTAPTFAALASRSVRSMTDGMIAHLGESGRTAAERLAGLGEVFSRTAALELVEGASLESLLFSGIVHELTTPRLRIPGPSDSDLPLAFSHSLVHRQLAERASLTLDELLKAASAPLYSILPYKLIAQCSALSHSEGGNLPDRINAILHTAIMLDGTPDWPLATPVWQAAENLLRLSYSTLDSRQIRALEIELLAVQLHLLRRTPATDHYSRCLERLLSLTEHPDTEPLARKRLEACAFALWLCPGRGAESYREICHDAAELIAQRPALRFTGEYLGLLRNRCHISGLISGLDDMDELRTIERDYRAVVESDSCPQEQRQRIREGVAPYLLRLFCTNGELEERRALYRQLLDEIDTKQSRFIVGETDFLAETCSIDELLKALDRGLPVLRELGMKLTSCFRSLMKLWGEGLIGRPLSEIEQEIAAIDALGYKRLHIGYAGFLYPVSLGFLVGDPAWSLRMIETYLDSSIGEWQIRALQLLATGALDRSHSAAELTDVLEGDEPVARVIALAVGGGEEWQDVGEEERRREFAVLVREALDIPLLRWTDILTVRVVLDIVLWVDRRTPEPALRPVMADAVERALQWLAERRLRPVLDSFLRDFGPLLQRKERAVWQKRAAKLAVAYRAAQPTHSTNHRLRLSMLGRIEVASRDGAMVVQPHGARQKAFLGALVAGEMLVKPLDRSEFLEAVGIEESDDPKLSRDAVNSALYRLREIVGRDAIAPAAGDHAPRLNCEAVAVDLLEAHDLLREGEEQLQRGAFGHAGVAVRRALEITRGDVPFPTLYDTFFEALREDFENRLRSIVLVVARRLLRELDAAGAEEVLERAFAITPDDEEVAELYCESLAVQGRRAEAERVRRKVEVV